MTLELYKKDSCPYCQRVMRFISSSGRTDIVYRDIVQSDRDNDILPSFDQYSHIPGVCHRQALGGKTEMENPGEDVVGTFHYRRICRRPYRNVLFQA